MFLRDAIVAEDVAADVFLKTFVGLRVQYRPQHFKPWLLTLAKHQCINHVKQAVERLRGGSADGLDFARPGDPTVAIDIESVLGHLPAPQRIAIKLFYVNRYSYEEIGEIQGWTSKEVKSHLQNARRRFKLLWDRAAQGTET